MDTVMSEPASVCAKSAVILVKPTSSSPTIPCKTRLFTLIVAVVVSSYTLLLTEKLPSIVNSRVLVVNEISLA